MKTSEGESVEFQTLSDDEEITIPLQDRDKKIAYVRNIDIRDEHLENTKREDWPLPTESMHGARPRQTGRERPPVIDNPVFRDAEEIYGRGSIYTAEGGRSAPEPQGVPREVRAVPQIFSDDSLRDSDQGRKNFRSPVEMLVNTVSHMQKYLAILHEENRILRTPATSQVIQAPRRGGAHDDQSAAVRRNYKLGTISPSV